MQKQARLFKIDTNSTAFQEIIRCYWMPTLLKKIEESSSSSGMIFQNSAIPQPLDTAYQHHYAAAAQVPTGQGPLCLSQSLNHLEQNPDPDQNCNSSVNFSQIPQLSEYPSFDQFHAIVDNEYETYLKGCCPGDNSNYEMETFNLGSIRAPGNFENLISNSQAVERNWVDNDFSGGLWNT